MFINESICDIAFVDVNQNLKIGVILNMLLSDYTINAKILLEFNPTDDVYIINHEKFVMTMNNIKKKYLSK